MKIGILGSGLMGGKLGTLFTQAGHSVVFSYARTQKKLNKLARDAGKKAKAGTPAEAVKDADVVLLAVHWSRISDVLKQAGSLSGKVVMSCSLPMNASDTALVVGRTTSGAEQLAKRLPKAHVVSAFNTIPSEVLFDVFAKQKKKKKKKKGKKGEKKSRRPDVLFCGDHKASKRKVAGLIRELGFEPVDLGGLQMARYTEPFALAIAELAYNGKKGPRMTYRFEWMTD